MEQTELKNAIKSLSEQTSSIQERLAVLEKQLNNGLKEDSRNHSKDIQDIKLAIEQIKGDGQVRKVEFERDARQLSSDIGSVAKDVNNVVDRLSLRIMELEEKILSKAERILSQRGAEFEEKLNTHAADEAAKDDQRFTLFNELKSQLRAIVIVGGAVWSCALMVGSVLLDHFLK